MDIVETPQCIFSTEGAFPDDVRTVLLIVIPRAYGAFFVPFGAFVCIVGVLEALLELEVSLQVSLQVSLHVLYKCL